MRWGFGWELGPSRLGRYRRGEISRENEGEGERSRKRRADARVRSKSFYKKEAAQRFYYDFAAGKYVPLADPRRHCSEIN